MTWSIVARDVHTGHLGIAVATRFFAAGALVPFVAPGAGAIATQAMVNPYYGIDGLNALARGLPLEPVLQGLLAADEGRSYRQVHAVDAGGRTFAYTGQDCLAYSGHLLGDQWSVAGNMLASGDVLLRTAEAFAANAAVPFAARLILAMEAGQDAGGDRRGRQSAALLIGGQHEWPILDLRVDDHCSPLEELARLERVSREEWSGFMKFIPTRDRPSGITDEAVIQQCLRHGLETRA
jgi:uncharacterized Ntn-hydrolase superfamily protein